MQQQGRRGLESPFCPCCGIRVPLLACASAPRVQQLASASALPCHSSRVLLLAQAAAPRMPLLACPIGRWASPPGRPPPTDPSKCLLLLLVQAAALASCCISQLPRRGPQRHSRPSPVPTPSVSALARNQLLGAADGHLSSAGAWFRACFTQAAKRAISGGQTAPGPELPERHWV